MSNRVRPLVAAVVAAVALSGSGSAQADGAMMVLKPNKGISFDIGRERAVAYFRPANGACNVMLLLTPQLDDERPLPEASSRMSAPVLPGRSARVDTPDGHSLELGCAAGAKEMTVRSVPQVAWSRTE